MCKRWLEFAVASMLALAVISGWHGRALAGAESLVAKNAAEQIRGQLSAGGNYALLIGISAFDDRAWSDLAGIAPEMEAVEAAFVQHGFQIVTPGHGGGSRMTKHELRKAIQDFVAIYGKPQNRLIVYLASHGYRDVSMPDSVGYVVTSDSPQPGRSGFSAAAYSVAELESDLASNEARHLFLFVNTCFSGALMPVMRLRSMAETTGDGAEPAALSQDVARWMQRNLSRDARLILTAGDAAQEVPDDSEYWRAVVDGLAGGADGNRDGLILGTELAAYVKGRVGPRTLAMGIANDPLFAYLPAGESGQDAPGEYVFLSPQGPSAAASAGISQSQEVLAARRSRLQEREFTECADCPVMVALPPLAAGDGGQRRLALARTETTFAEWDACFRDLACRRYIPDHGQGRGDRPVGDVTWQDVLEFTAWLNASKGDRCEAYRLPTREEWLAGAGLADLADAPSPVPAGVARMERAVCAGCAGGAGGAPVRVASTPPNVLGFHDMEGNLWEWVLPDGDQCAIDDIRDGRRCMQDGMVLGGSFATDAAALDRAMLEGASLPRTGNARPFSLPTVGFRSACELRPG